MAAGARRRRAQEENGVVVALRRQDRQAQADLRDGPAQPREQRRDPRLRRPGRALGRRHVHERPADRRAGAPSRDVSTRRSRSSTRTSRRDTDALLADEGDLWAFVSDTPGVDELLRLRPGLGTRVVSGHFIKVPKNIATGTQRRTASEVKAADVGYPLPPTNGSWQRDLRATARRRHRRPAVGARVLERHQQRLPVRPRRGHRLRQAARAWATSSTSSTRGVATAPARPDTPGQLDERSRLEDGARPERPDEGDVADRSLVEGDDNPVKTPRPRSTSRTTSRRRRPASC